METWDLPAEPIDAVILQRPAEEELTRKLTGRRPGADLPAVYLEHDAPDRDVPLTRHRMADRPDLRLVHVTHFNDLFWDCGRTPTTVIEHGIVDPGPRWTGECPRAAVVVNANVAARLHEHVLERTRSYEPARVVDAYAGTGATALPMLGSCSSATRSPAGT